MPTITRSHPKAYEAFSELYELVQASPFGASRTDLEAWAILNGADLNALAFWVDALQLAHLAEVRTDQHGTPRLYPIA